MTMRFHSYYSLKLFDAVARHMSFAAAAAELNRSKGSISYRISKLEDDLGFMVFHRNHPRISLTPKGKRLWHASQVALGQLDKEIAELGDESPGSITIGTLTYLSSRWLSPRLTRFIESNPGVGVRVEPLNSLQDMKDYDLDIAILWGNGDWPDLECELLFSCPAVPTANPQLAARIAEHGMENSLSEITLLADSSGDKGWRDWHKKAGLSYDPDPHGLVITDSSSRVQAVIDGQGVALWDALVEPEVQSGRLVFVSDIRLDDSGYYLVFPKGTPNSPVVTSFRQWITEEASAAQPI